MKKLLFLLLILVSVVCHGQIVKKMVIDTFIPRKGQNILLLHKIGDNYYAGLNYKWKGLGEPDIAIGDTAVLVKNSRRHFYLPFVTILKRKQ